MKQLFSIRERERTWRIILISVVVLSFIFSGFVFIQSKLLIEESKKNIYVLINDKSLVKAKATDITNSYDILTQSAINHFNQLIYAHVPDGDQMNKQLREAVNMSDKSTSNLIDSYLESGFYKSLISQNYYTILTTDTIQINYSSDPHYFKYKGQLKIIRGDQSSLREITNEGYIQNTGKSSMSNERGYYISKFSLIDDKAIQ